MIGNDQVISRDKVVYDMLWDTCKDVLEERLHALFGEEYDDVIRALLKKRYEFKCDRGFNYITWLNKQDDLDLVQFASAITGRRITYIMDGEDGDVEKYSFEERIN